MKRVIPDIKKVNISTLKQSDREVVDVHLDRVEQFAVDIATIRDEDKKEANTLVADNLIKSFKSKQAAVFAESEIIAKRVRRGNVELLEISSISSDAYYIQQKTGGIYVRLEIKSVTQTNASAVDKEITNAETQHRDRLADEQGKPTWHKTTIVVGNDNNPWPCRNMQDFEQFQNNPAQLQAMAEHRLQKLVMGSLKPSKKLENRLTRVTMKQLQAAEIAQTNAEKALLLNEKRQPPTATATVVTTPVKRPLPPNPPTTPQKGPPFSPSSASVTPSKRPLPPDPPARAAIPVAEPMPLRYGRTASAVNRAPPPSPIAQRIIARKEELKGLAQKNTELKGESRLKRRLLVTEQVTVICSHLNLTFVLNRRADKFVAHIKGDEKPLGEAKRERKHWNVPTPVRTHWRKSANKEGNTPLHLAVKEQNEELVKFYMKNPQMNQANIAGDLPIHIAVMMGNKDIVRILATDAESLSEVNKNGETALELAHSTGNEEVANTLIQAGALGSESEKKPPSKSNF